MAADDGEEFAVVDSFYRAFEDRHRGSRDLIKSRLAKYAAFFQPLASLHPGAMTFDVGCGRGEWLELMIEAGFVASGVDLDDEMLEACRERNLPVSKGDAIAHLATLDSNSHALISAFHVVEHVSFEQLKTLVSEALRVLKPGGLLILETPNPENIAVATCNFYIDPSHQKPVPPLLLSFVAEHAGFDRVKVVRLQEPEALHDAQTKVHLLNILGSVSPDYAIVAQKEAGSTQGEFDSAFDADYGLTIDTLADRYETRLAANLSHVDAKVERAEEAMRLSAKRWSELIDRLQTVTEQLTSAEERYQRIEERRQLVDERQVLELQARLEQAEAMMHQAHAQLHAMYHSTSWKITRPLRIVALVLKGQGKTVFKAGLKRIIQQAARFGDKHPSFRRFAVSVLNRFPGLKQRLIPVVSGTVNPYRPRPDLPPESLSPRAQQIHAAMAFAAKRYSKKEGA
ncbi:methyltransferase domain-containing protein [Burkholderia metallica]|uniref:methyltransferase domain-containing protein n=1 Tax=Burkholderia metallica TaxID=488729 RepID=UPI001FC7BBE8|nr:methyltransferase domain-containing protein [Burkholderia metallica]